MKKARKILAFTIVAALLMQSSGFAFAASAGNGQSSGSNNAAMASEEVTIIDSGKCGADVVWELDSEGTLTVFGTGKMYDEPKSEDTPWYGYEDSIRKVIIEDGVTKIGNWAFGGLGNLTEAEIAGSVTLIGNYAFKMTGLKEITIPEGVKVIEMEAFRQSPDLESVILPDSLIRIESYAFAQCTSLKDINIPEEISEIKENAFWGCSSLSKIEFSNNLTGIGIRAFIQCSNLKEVYIPETVTNIGESAFGSDTVINGFKNSEAEQFAGENGNEFVPVKVFFQWEGTDKCKAFFKDMNGNVMKTVDCTVTEKTAAEMASCTEDGYDSYVAEATVCDYVYTDVKKTDKNHIPAIGHSWKAEFGWKGDACKITLTCGNCGEAVKDDCEVITEITKEASCTETGLKNLTAEFTYDGESYTDIKNDVTVKKAEHSYEAYFDWLSNNKCLYTLECVVCGKKYKGDCIVIGEGRSATCYREGLVTLTAKIPDLKDGYVFEDVRENVVIPITHKWNSDFTVDKMPTETEQGQVSIHCSLCGCIDPDSITAVPAYITRIAGSNRYATSIKAAEYLAELAGVEKFENIVVACGTNFADALSGSYLANVKEAPVIVVDTASPASYEEVMKYIRGKIASHGTVYILGGTGAVSQEFQDELEARGIDTQRLGGKDRYATNIEILKEAGVDSLYYGDMMIACGSNFADALSASAVGLPIMLTGEGLNENQQQYLQRVDIDTAYILGGTGAVSEATREQVGEYTEYTCRLAGSNRFETSLAIAEAFFPYERDAVVLAVGDNFPDGLSAGPLAMVQDAPLILVMDNVTEHAEKYAYNHECMWAVVMGGEPLISNDAVRRIIQ